MRFNWRALRHAVTIALALVIVTGCAVMSKQEARIQGSWTASGHNSDTDMSWEVNWTFDNGVYSQSGYPPISVKGRYKVVSTTKGSLTLKLYASKGTFTEDRKLRVDLPEGKRIRIQKRLLSPQLPVNR